MTVHAFAAGEESLGRSYRLDVDLRSFETGTISATVNAEITNHGTAPLSDLELVLYPNRFRAELPNLNDLNYRRVYTDGFSSGGIEIEESRVDSVPVEVAVSGTFGRISLPHPLQPGKSVRLSFRYRLTIPEKYGTFGRYGEKLTLSGGWYPYVASFREGAFQREDLPAPSDWTVSIRSDREVLLNGRPVPALTAGTPIEFRGARELSLWTGPDIRRTDLAGSRIQARIWTDERSPQEAIEPLKGLVVRWLEFVERHPELSQGAREVTLAQAPLREMLAMDGEGMTFVSDRAFKLLSILGQYHTPPIVRGLFAQLVFPEVSTRESSRDYGWVTEAVSWGWTERFMREEAYSHRDARTLGPVRFFSFLPALDQVIYAPQFAFIDVFYDMIYPYDPVRDDALRFNHLRTNGRTIYAHLEDDVGPRKALEIVVAYVGSDQQKLVALAGNLAGHPLHDRFEQWIAPRPAVNYILGKREQKRTTTGYEHSVFVRRETEAVVREPVELGVRTKRGENLALKWDDAEKEHEFRFETKSPVKILEVDPRRRLLETRLSDNRSPPYYKLVLTDWVVNYDFNNDQPEGFIATQFRRSYGGSNRYNFVGSYSHDSYGIGASYTRLFGKLIDRLRLSHALNAGFNYSRLSDDNAVASFPGQTPKIEPVGPAGNATSIGVSYGFGNQLSLTNPLTGGGGSISATWGSKYFGGDFHYYRFGLGGSWVFRLHPSHLLAARGFLGFAGPAAIPSQETFDLGGLGGLRGLSFADDRFKGRNLILWSAEYRHFVFQDIDWNLGIFRIRDLQGALFTDAGRVTDTVQERADQLAFPALAQATGRADLLHVAHYQTDAGYGIRFLIDWLGVNPALLVFDFAKGLNDIGSKARFYFGVTQSF
ncbi:MAG: hypothetical protein V1495_07640 [Pseudomonadota bacterium]